MPAMTNLVVKDDNATDVTFVPVKDVPFPEWRTDNYALPLEGQPRFSMAWETLKDKSMRVNAKLVVPVMEIIPAGTVDASGRQAAAAVAFADTYSFTAITNKRSTNENIADGARMFLSFLCGATQTASSGYTPNGTSPADTFLNATSPVLYGMIHRLFPGA